MARPLPLRTGFDRERTSPFGYACSACNRCCLDKVIRLNPYEVLRLATLLGLSTTETIAKFTRDGGASLAARDDGSCVFLGPQGCTVHSARPLSCRLYPLGRHRAPSGEERFAEVEPHPESAGDYHGRGTVNDYLRAQEAHAYIEASDRYLEVLKRMLVALAARDDAAAACEEASETLRDRPAEADTSLLDVDVAVARFCAERGEPVPETVEGKFAVHLRALEAVLD